MFRGTHMAEQKGYDFLASPFVFSSAFSPYILLHIFHERKEKEQRTDPTICFNFITVLFFSFELFIQFIQFIHQFIFRNIQKYKLERERDAHRWKRFQLFPKLLLPVIIYYYSSVRIMLAKNFNCQWIVTIIKRIERDGKIDTLNFQV